MKTALRAFLLIAFVSAIAGAYFLFAPEHAPAVGGAMTQADLTPLS